MYTTPQVFDEVARGKSVEMRARGLIDSGRLKILSPDMESIAKISSSSREIEGSSILTDADLSIIALGIEMTKQTSGKKVVIVTDDYAIQNVASSLNVEYQPVMTKGIRDKGDWLVYCPGCGREQEKETKLCEICGTAYRRRLTAKRHSHKSK